MIANILYKIKLQAKRNPSSSQHRRGQKSKIWTKNCIVMWIKWRGNITTIIDSKSNIIAMSQFVFGFPLHTFFIINHLFFLSAPYIPIINFSTYFHTFSNIVPPFYLFISPFISALISHFIYPFIFLLFLTFLIPIHLL